MVIYICTKFHENILDGIKVIDRTWFSWVKVSKGRDSLKNVGGIMFFFFAHCLMVVYN